MYQLRGNAISSYILLAPKMNKKGRAYRRSILRQLGHLCLLRPAAFRPPLAKGLALSCYLVFRDLN